ncbi:hypothetical protein SDC9_98584 [bioreactor metagenome]|uniref:Uncharacterized protein n=1 Tax=bioreactor metagenome TaxID=1076179 RepID=A0A645ALX3_9ZZZZ
MKRLLRIIGSNKRFKENLVYSFCSLGIHYAIRHYNPSKSRDRICRQSSIPGFFYRAAAGHAASVVVFEDGQRRFIKIGHQRNGCIYVEQVVVRNLLAVQLLKGLIKIAVKNSFLMGVLTVPQCFAIVGRNT